MFKSHSYEWIVEELREKPGYYEKNMFSCRACYFLYRLCLVLADNEEEEWNGLLVPTSKEHHLSLIEQFSQLTSHPVLGKWLFISSQDESFEEVSLEIAKLVLLKDHRIGVFPKEKKKKTPRKKSKRK